MKKTASDMCFEMADFFDDETHKWVKRSLAVDEDGWACTPYAPHAVGWCITGLGIKFINGPEYHDFHYQDAMEAIRHAHNSGRPVVHINDYILEYKSEVITLLRAAGHNLKAKGL